jgi:hypothetical protein
MKTYIITFLLVCGASAVAALLSPGGKIKKYIQFILSVVTLTAMFSPLTTLSDNLENPFPDVPITDGESGEHGLLLATEESLRGVICTQFELPKNEVLVEIIGEVSASGEVDIRRIVVTLLGDSTRYREGVRTYLKGHTTCEVEVHVGETRETVTWEITTHASRDFGRGAHPLWLL